MPTLQVLLADDDAVNLMVVERMLTSGLKKLNFDFECVVQTISEGDKVFNKALQQNFDVILLDWEMPEMDGIEVLKLLKANPQTAEVPVIMVTSNTTSEHVRIAFDAGATDYIKKPIEPQELLSRMKTVTQISNSYREIKNMNKHILAQQKEISASIFYARKLQQAMMPSEDTLKSIFSDFFVLNRPRDIVSGDFYWAAETEDFKIFALADCTGHGVPAAMMSMLGNNLLNDAILNRGFDDPADVLNYLHNGVRKALHQSSSDSKDGMDIALIFYNKHFSEITFACANASFYLLNDNEIFDFKGDRISIGGKQLEESRIFITQTVPHHLNNGRFFFTSDGYTDQFGGDDFKKFLIKRFKELILNTSELSLVDTQTMFENNLNTWIGNNKQMDDILVIGAKF